MNQPAISFVMCVYNGEKTIAAAIESVLAQSFSKWEFIIVDDGSFDLTAKIVKSFSDPRIELLQNPMNMDIPRSANRGLAAARGRYIARMDCDDIVHPDRAQTQHTYMESHPHVAVLGTFMEAFYDNSPTETAGVLRYPLDPSSVAAGLPFRNTIAQPSVMLRRAALEEARLAYDESFPRAEDYDLWARCCEKGLTMANLPHVLTRYRLHPSQATVTDNPTMSQAARRIRARLVALTGVAASETDMLLHEALSVDQFIPTFDFINDAMRWLMQLAVANEASRRFDRTAFLGVLTGRFVALVRFARNRGIRHIDPVATPFAPFINRGAI